MVEGIHCASCVALIEMRLKPLAGVERVSVSLASHRARLRYDDRRIELRALLAEIAACGYRAWPVAAADAGRRKTALRRTALWRLFVAGFAMMQVMMYAFPAYLAGDGEMPADIDQLLRAASLLLSIPVLVFSASPFLAGAWRDVRHRRVGMDLPIALGILVTFIASTWNVIAGTGSVYFDSLTMFVFVLLGGRYLEMLARDKAGAAIEDLARLQAVRAERYVSFPESLACEEVDSGQLQVGDYVRVGPGAVVPADGTVLGGCSHCDESLLTGESASVAKVMGDTVMGGTLNLDRPLKIVVTRATADSRLAGIVRLVEEAATAKPRMVQTADGYARHFLWGVLALALASGLAWAHSSPMKGLWVAITVLVVTCPCALSLAAPVAMSAAIGGLARRGMLVTRGAAVETLAQATHFVFDKTGTLTNGRMDLLAVTTFRGMTRDQALRIAAALERDALHPIGRSLCMHAAGAGGDALVCEEAGEVAGQGVEGRIGGTVYRIGRPGFAFPCLPADEAGARLARGSVAVLADAEGALAVFLLGDGVRDGAQRLVADLRACGRKVLLLSGDRTDCARQVGCALGLDEVHGQMQPDEKSRFVADLQAGGAVVAMIGDGINDAPALALADVSIAMGSGAPLAQTRADMVLMSGRLSDIDAARGAAARTVRVVRENLIWAAAYNLIAVPAAALGMLSPWMAGIGMAASSAIVIANSLRVTRIPVAPGEMRLPQGAG